MATTTTTTVAPSNLRASSRQTRTNPSRTTKASNLRQNSLISNQLAAPAPQEPHGFYPAITHFTDAISAIPPEYQRHTSLLKEVDAKGWALEEKVQTLLAAAIAAKPPRPTATDPDNAAEFQEGAVDRQLTQRSAEGAASHVADNASQHSAAPHNDETLHRRQVFFDLRNNLAQMMITMDEKNHVISNANEDLFRHMRRLESVFPYIANEVSEEARFGSLTHWAYLENRTATKASGHGSRRDAAAGLAILGDADIASRSESRREAMIARKQRQNHVDSDFDDPRTTTRKVNGNGKRRRIGEIAAEAAGLGISNANLGSKRKRVERPAPGHLTAGEILGSANIGGRAMSREPSQQDGGARKRKAATSAAGPPKKRANNNISAADSPALASSPIPGGLAKDSFKSSPILGHARPHASRARQNSTQTVDSSWARPASSTSHKNTSNGNGMTTTHPELKVAAMTGKSVHEVRSTMVETTNNKGDRLIEEDAGMTNGTNGEPVRGGILLDGTNSKIASLKREADVSEESLSKSGASPRLPPASIRTDRLERPNRGRTSKTATPVVGTFSEAMDSLDATSANGVKSKRPQPRSRIKDQLYDSLSPASLPIKRSHKKGAGLAAQAAAQARIAAEAAGDAASSMADGEQDDDEDANGEEEKYCRCKNVSYGEMVACDAKDCPTEWFHLECVGLDKAPGKNTKWYCDDCKNNLRRGKFGSVGGNGK